MVRLMEGPVKRIQQQWQEAEERRVREDMELEAAMAAAQWEEEETGWREAERQWHLEEMEWEEVEKEKRRKKREGKQKRMEEEETESDGESEKTKKVRN